MDDLTVRDGGVLTGDSNRRSINVEVTGNIHISPGGHVGTTQQGNVTKGKGVSLRATAGTVYVGGTVNGGKGNVTLKSEYSSVIVGSTGRVESEGNISLNAEKAGKVKIEGTVNAGKNLKIRSRGWTKVAASGSLKAGGKIDIRSARGSVRLLGPVEANGIVIIMAGDDSLVVIDDTVRSKHNGVNINCKSKNPGNVVINGGVIAKTKVRINADTLFVNGTIRCKRINKKGVVIVLGPDGKIENPQGESLIKANQNVVRRQQTGPREESQEEHGEKAKDYFAIGGPGSIMDFSMSPWAVYSDDKVEVVTGPGGTIDFTKNAPGIPVIQAMGTCYLYADKILLDPGVKLPHIIFPGQVQAFPSRFAQQVCIASGGSQFGVLGDTVELWFVVTNMGNTKDTYDISFTDSLGWDLDPSHMTLEVRWPGDSVVTVEVSVPGGASIGDSNRVTMRAVSTSDSTAFFESDAIIWVEKEIPPYLDFSVTPWEDGFGSPGDTVSVAFWLMNTGEVDDQYQVAVTDSLGWPLTPSSLTLGLPSLSDTILFVEVVIPETATVEDCITMHAVSITDSEAYYEGMSIAWPMISRHLKERALEELEALRPTGDKKLDKKIDKIAKYIRKSLKDKLWVDDHHVHSKHGKKVFDKEKKAVKDLMKESKKKKLPDPIKAVFSAVIVKLLDADECLARTAIDDARASPDPREKEIRKAEKEMAKAEKERGKGKYDKAIDHYKKAWDHAQKAMKKHKKPKHEQLVISDRGIPNFFSLSQNYPNPVTNWTTIQYTLPKDCHVTLEVYNVAGHKVTMLLDEEQRAGYRSVKLETNTLSTGVYFYRLNAGEFTSTRKVVVLR